MLYQQKSFTVPAAPKPSKVQACPRCVYGEPRHSPDCAAAVNIACTRCKSPIQLDREYLHEYELCMEIALPVLCETCVRIEYPDLIA